MNQAALRVPAVFMLLVLSGCATLFSSSTQLPVQTNPPGAVVYVNGMPAGQTPTLIQLDSRQPANIQIVLPGFQPVQMWRAKGFSGWFWVNILFWPGFLIDLATGKYQKYDDTGIAIGLMPAPDYVPPEEQQPPPYYPQQPPPPPGPAPVQPGTPPAPGSAR